MARDYLAIQGSSTSAERDFSSGTLTGTKLRNRLAPDLFEVLQLLKSGYRNGQISAGEYAAKHKEALIEELNDLRYGFEGFGEEDDDMGEENSALTY